MTAQILDMFLFRFRAACEICLVSDGPKNTLQSLSNMPFCAYLKYNTKTTGHLPLYYIPNDPSTIKDASFHVKSSKVVITYKLWPHIYIHCCLVDLCANTQDKTQSTYDCTTHQTTTLLDRMHLFKTIKQGYNSWATVQNIHLLIMVASQIQCTLHVGYIN